MSAVACKPKSAESPPLPPELWLRILRFAACVPQLLDTDALLDFSPSSDQQRRRLHSRSFITKCHVIRVCKKWYSLASPLLYESLIIARGRALPKLRDTLKRSHERARYSDTGPSLGWWTKRLDIAMRDMIDSSDDSTGKLEMECLSNIIHCLPNLNILVISVSANLFERIIFPSALLHDLVQSSGNNLQAIVWRDDVHFRAPPDCQAVLGDCSQVKAMTCPVDSPETLKLNFSVLETLLIRVHADIRASNLPCLRRLIICEPTRDYMTGLLESHGAQLEIIQLSVDSQHRILPSWLKSISAFCPNLSRLDLSFDKWSSVYGLEMVLPESLRVLGIQSLKKQSPTSGYISLLETLQSMEIGSALQTVQFTDFGNLWDLRLKHPRMFRRCLNVLGWMGLAAEDPDGALLP